jgi:hypothetical protein
LFFAEPEKRLSHPSLSLLACLAALAYLDDGCEMSRVHMQAIVGICVRQNETPTLSRPHFQHLIWHDCKIQFHAIAEVLLCKKNETKLTSNQISSTGLGNTSETAVPIPSLRDVGGTPTERTRRGASSGHDYVIDPACAAILRYG